MTTCETLSEHCQKHCQIGKFAFYLAFGAKSSSTWFQKELLLSKQSIVLSD